MKRAIQDTITRLEERQTSIELNMLEVHIQTTHFALLRLQRELTIFKIELLKSLLRLWR